METKVVNVHKEPFDICIMRPSIYQNKYVIGIDGDRVEVVRKFDVYFQKRIATDLNYFQAVIKLLGKKIGCCCAPLACHGDIYVKFLNEYLMFLKGEGGEQK